MESMTTRITARGLRTVINWIRITTAREMSATPTTITTASPISGITAHYCTTQARKIWTVRAVNNYGT